MFVRRFATPDTPALYDVCLRTADGGGDATHLHDEPSLTGHVWLGPYLALEPDLAWVVDDGNGRALGYIVGAADTLAFEQLRERSWLPELRALYPERADATSALVSADAELVHMIHHPPAPPLRFIEDYPSHLHIDLLPEAQGGGFGRVLMETLCSTLGRMGSIGVYVGVAATNARALAFYRRVEFVDLDTTGNAVWLGRRLTRTDAN